MTVHRWLGRYRNHGGGSGGEGAVGGPKGELLARAHRAHLVPWEDPPHGQRLLLAKVVVR